MVAGAVVLSTAVPRPANAQAPSALPQQAFPAGPPVRQSFGPAQGLTPEIQSLLRRLINTYQTAESYRDHGKVTLIQSSGRVKTTTEMPMELAFKRPNLMLLDAGQHVAASDGKSVFFVLPGLSQFTSNTAPARLERKHLQAGTILGGVDEGHPELTDLLLRDDAYAVWTSQIAKIGWRTNTAGERLLTYETEQGTQIALTVDTNRMMIVRVAAQYTGPPADAVPANAAPMIPNAPSLIRVAYDLGTVELNPKLEPGAFAYKPPASFKRVTSFDFGGPSDSDHPDNQEPVATEGGHLVGKPLPPIQASDLAGRPFEAAEVKGKGLLLFFWSLSGGQYTLTSLPIIQQVADQFNDRKDLLVLGVCPDADQKETVAELLRRKNVSVRNLLDQDRRLMRTMQLAGEPTFIIVGPDGLVKWAKLGAPESLKGDLVREIQNMLPKPGNSR